MNSTSVIIKPVISEQSMKEADHGKFTFQVIKTAGKDVIKKVIEGQFKVNVVGLSTSVMKGNRKRVGKQRREISASSWKKAVVTLKKGQKIDLFDLTGAEEETK